MTSEKFCRETIKQTILEFFEKYYEAFFVANFLSKRGHVEYRKRLLLLVKVKICLDSK